jgi:hypothetical protein
LFGFTSKVLRPLLFHHTFVKGPLSRGLRFVDAEYYDRLRRDLEPALAGISDDTLLTGAWYADGGTHPPHRRKDPPALSSLGKELLEAADLLISDPALAIVSPGLLRS